MSEQQRTVPAARYTAPAGVLTAPQYRPEIASGTSQVDPLEAAEPESSLRSVPLPFLGSLFADFTLKRFLTCPACSLVSSSVDLGFWGGARARGMPRVVVARVGLG